MNRIILALDTTNLNEAISVTKKIKNKIFTIKLGLEFFNAHGKEGVKKFNEIGITNLMLDLKLKDIPETVYKAIKALNDIKFGFVSCNNNGDTTNWASGWSNLLKQEPEVLIHIGDQIYADSVWGKSPNELKQLYQRMNIVLQK